MTVRDEGASLSVMLTTASSVVPALTPAGRFTNVSFTDSPSSSSASSSAVNVKLFSVSPESKVTLVGTPL